VDLFNALEHEKLLNKLERIPQSLARLDLVILDELGYLLLTQAGGAVLFHLLSKQYELTSVLITTNLPLAKWSSVFADVKMTVIPPISTDPKSRTVMQLWRDAALV